MNEQNLKTQLAELKSQAEDINQKIADVQAELEKPKNTMESWVMERNSGTKKIAVFQTKHCDNRICMSVHGERCSLSHPEAAELAMQLLNAIRQQRGMDYEDDLYNPYPIHQPTNAYVKAGLYNTSHLLAVLKKVSYHPKSNELRIEQLIAGSYNANQCRELSLKWWRSGMALDGAREIDG